jgi:3-oxoacyl-ACP reductase-like protein
MTQFTPTVDILAIIISQKLKKQLSEVPLSKSIKELSNGKSLRERYLHTSRRITLSYGMS